MFMADHSCCCGEHFALWVKLVSLFIVTSACFDEVVLKLSCEKDSHFLFLSINIGHCAAKGGIFIIYRGIERVERKHNKHQGGQLNFFKMKCPN